MSMYNQLFGQNPYAALLLELVGISSEDYPIPRFRDVHLNEERDRIVVLTRTGGGNRDTYQQENDRLGEHPLYDGNWDDDFDSTYAHFRFRIPEIALEAIKELPEMSVRSGNFSEVFRAFMEKLKEGDESDPQVKRALAVGERLFDQIQKGKKVIEV